VTAIFITATGPDVGKTLVVASLIRHLQRIGHSVDVLKPIVCGYEPAQAATSELATLIAAVGSPFSPETIERMSPWRFRAALPPDLAAQLEKRRIDVADVIAYCKEAVEGRRDVLLIDGTGGVMTPLDPDRTMLDVMMALRLPLILVAGSYDGALSHTLTALDSLFRRDMSLLATIVSETPGSRVPLDEAVAAIARFTEPVIGLPRQRA
jgi:dethiobiotin synthetase